MMPAVFFDRDGVLNEEKGYVYKKEDFVWMPGAIEAIKFLNQHGYYVFVVTNQSGVARGYYTNAEVEALHTYMQEQLAFHDAKIDKFYYCPHHPDFTDACSCRKPEPGMIKQGLAEFDVDKARSFLLGDKKRDLEAARNAGITGYLFKEGNLLEKICEILKNQEGFNENI